LSSARARWQTLNAIRDLRNHQYLGIEPTADDILFALKVLDKVAPALLSLLGRQS